MKIDEWWDEDALLLVPHGELDYASAHALEDALAEGRRNGARLITLDLEGLTFLDSVGIRVFVNAARIAEQEGPPLALLPGPPFVQKRLRLVGLEEWLPFAKRPEVPRPAPERPAG